VIEPLKSGSILDYQIHLDHEELQKYTELTEKRAKIDAKIYNTYIIYKNKKIVREYPNGKVVIDNVNNNTKNT
jgi:hypothetical protein